MALKISLSLKKALQDELKISKADVEDYVWNHKPKECFLCGAELNRAKDDIELDHDKPINEGGGDELSNLNLTHVACNRYKRNNPSFDVRPHLRFKRFFDENMGHVRFQDAKNFFALSKSECFFKLSEDGSSANLETSDGKFDATVHKEHVNGKEQLFCFADLPISCIENDDAIQPREIKLNHLLSISTDLKKNPLHEQPAVRLSGTGDKKQFLMFDGQHKTVAHLINGRRSVTFKIYININKEEAVRLVNSIQARIKKLPLTPFEMATKMSDEVRRKLEDYEEEVGSLHVSEEGFIKWLDSADRTRARSGIEAAVLDSIISDPGLAFRKIISRPGKPGPEDIKIQEAAFQSKILKVLLRTKPLSSAFKGEAMKEAREREARNVLKILNLCYDKGYTPNPEKDIAAETARIKRLTYQASLRQLCEIMLQICASHFMARETVLIEREITPDLLDKLGAAAERFFAHPVWEADLTKGTKAKLVDDALKKNQNIEEAFSAVMLTAGYCGGLDKLPSNWAGV